MNPSEVPNLHYLYLLTFFFFECRIRLLAKYQCTMHVIFEMILIFLINADHYMKWMDEIQLASAPFRLLASIQPIRRSREENQFN